MKHPLPAEGLLHPVAVGAVVLLILNDHVFKALWPGLVTGKLSDVAGMIFFPILLQGLVELGQAGAGHVAGPRLGTLAVSCLLTALVFTWVKTSPAGAEAYRHVLGMLQWPPRMVFALLSGQGPVTPGLVRYVRDPSDVVAVPGVLVALCLGWQRRAVQQRDVGVTL